MKSNLEYLRREVVAYLEQRNLAVFKSFPCGPELGTEAVYWDSHAYPDFREFVGVAEAAGVRLLTVYGREFHSGIIDDALNQVETSKLDREERRDLAARLRDMRAFEGFICEIEISFSYGGRTYIFDQPTPWYEEVSEILDRIEQAMSPNGERPLGGNYSNN